MVSECSALENTCVPAAASISASPWSSSSVGTSLNVKPMTSNPPEYDWVMLSTLSLWNEAIIMTTTTVNMISEKMNSVRAVLNFLFIG